MVAARERESASAGHEPVLVEDVVALLAPRDGGIYVDGTFGAGGYSRAILEAADCVVWAIDRDPDAVERGERMAEGYGGRLTVLAGRFGELRSILAARSVTSVDGVTLDLGVSSQQLDDPGRGFSFKADGPLDMRMERTGATAADLVNDADEERLADIIFQFGGERRARRIARAINRARRRSPIKRTDELAAVVRAAAPAARADRGRIDPATRTFQALRIYVNDELDEIDGGLDDAEAILAPGGVLVVVSFHSLEDKRVKDFFRTRSGGAPKGSRFLPAGESGSAAAPTFELLTRRAGRPREEEFVRNPRARSARLRAGRRTEAPAVMAAETQGLSA